MIPSVAWVGIILVLAALVAVVVIVSILVRSSDGRAQQNTRRPTPTVRGPRTGTPSPNTGRAAGGGTAIYTATPQPPHNTGTTIDPFDGAPPRTTGTEIDPFGTLPADDPHTEDSNTEIDPAMLSEVEDTEIDVAADTLAEPPFPDIAHDALDETQIDPAMRAELMRRQAAAHQTGAFGYLHTADGVYEIASGRTTIGSLPACNITLHGDDNIAFEHLEVEARMKAAGAVVSVTPLISRGVLYNGQPLVDSVQLQEGDNIQLSPQTRLTYSRNYSLD